MVASHPAPRHRRQSTAWFAFALVLLALPALAADKGAGGDSPAADCSLLDDPKTAGMMDGLLHYLAKQCGREAEFLGGVRSDEGFGVPGFEPSLADAAVSNPAQDTSGTAKTQSETSIAFDPDDNVLCGAFNDSFHGVTQSLGFSGNSRSLDGGANWTDYGPISSDDSGDPSLVWRRLDGHFYYAALRNGGLGLYKSTDNCQSFTFLSQISSGSDDKELMAVDNNPASPYYGRLYVVWTDFGTAGDEIYSTYSTDAGATWSAQVMVSGAGDDVQGAWPAVAPNGDVYVTWVRWNPWPSGPIDAQVSRSTNGGVSYAAVTAPMTGKTNPRDSAATTSCFRPALGGNIRYLPSPTIAVDGSGNLHIVYSYDPDAFASGDESNIYYRRSTNQGTSWEPEILINDDGGTTDQWQPSLSVGTGNVVTIGYYSRQNDPVGNNLFDYYARTSYDGGATFATSVRLSDVSSSVVLDPNLATCYHGDYDTQTHSVGKAHYLWSDDRGSTPDIFTEWTPGGTNFQLYSQQVSRRICAGENPTYPIDVLQFQGFTEAVTLSATGNPAPSTTGFVPNGQAVPFSSTLTIGNTGGVGAGTSTITVTGTSSPGSIVHSTIVGLTVHTSAPGTSTLSSPADGASQVALVPSFTWNPAPDATGYVLELDNDASFASPFYTVAVAGTSYALSTPLPRGTQVYWRVTATNPCGSGTVSGAFDFTTSNALCWQPNLAIPDDPDVSDTRTVSGFSGTITDLDLILRATHTYVADMVFRLVHVDTGTTVTVIDRPGSCGGDNFDVRLNDEGTDGTVESACNPTPPAVSGNRTPNNPLSAFDTQSLNGSWRLECSDQAAIDVGNVQEWCLDATGVVDGSLFSDDFEFGSTGLWSATGT